MIYGTTPRMPGEFTEQYTVDAHTDLSNYSDKLRVAMSRLQLCPPRDSPQKNIFQYKELETCLHVYLEKKRNCATSDHPFDGPYKVISRSGRVKKILMKGKVEVITVDRVKPMRFEREPESGTTTHRQSKPKPKSTTPKPAAITRKPRKV